MPRTKNTEGGKPAGPKQEGRGKEKGGRTNQKKVRELVVLKKGPFPRLPAEGGGLTMRRRGSFKGKRRGQAKKGEGFEVETPLRRCYLQVVSKDSI